MAGAFVQGQASQQGWIAGEGGPFQDAELAALDGQLEGILTELIEKAEFKGKQVSGSFQKMLVFVPRMHAVGVFMDPVRHQMNLGSISFPTELQLSSY